LRFMVSCHSRRIARGLRGPLGRCPLRGPEEGPGERFAKPFLGPHPKELRIGRRAQAIDAFLPLLDVDCDRRSFGTNLGPGVERIEGALGSFRERPGESLERAAVWKLFQLGYDAIERVFALLAQRFANELTGRVGEEATEESALPIAID